MSNKLRQVSKEEFEVLTRFHPGEVRYYVDVNKALNTRNKGAKVSVKRKPIKRVPQAPVGRGGNRANASRHVQLTTKGAGEMRADTMQYVIYCDATRILNEDPTKVLKRNELTAALAKRQQNLNKASQLVPAISALIKTGYLRYTGEAS